ncbi:MAG: hypothetical protein ACI9W4_002472 [Rhodothermales bacterium]|jgi:hypothetical protein
MKRILFSLLLCLAYSADAQQTQIDGLGTLSFPNSGTEQAQDAFLRGVLLMHSFEYGPSVTFFRDARTEDPSFALAYWGEAMTYNHPIWNQRDLEAGRAVLHQLGATPAVRRAKAGTTREKMYLDAVEMLYGDGSKEEQDLAYMDAMARLHEAYPDDDEATTFYALSILGSKAGERDFAMYMRAAAIAQPVFVGNPDHPGAAHYLIHSFDDPIHAPLGMLAANAYSDIAPDAAHAQHMTSHIFVAMGLWDRVVQANVRASGVQDTERSGRGMGPNTCGHYSSWLHYGYLMLGEYQEAESLMDACHASVAADEGSLFYFTIMRARHVMDTQDWTMSSRWTTDLNREAGNRTGEGIFGGAPFTYHLTNAFAALMQGDSQSAEQILSEDWGEHPGRLIQLDQLRGLLLTRTGRVDHGLALIKSAADAEAELPFEFGPPSIVKLGYELLGEALAGAGRDSSGAYREASARTPGRPLSMAAARPGSN